jgi:hypothetical protein
VIHLIRLFLAVAVNSIALPSRCPALALSLPFPAVSIYLPCPDQGDGKGREGNLNTLGVGWRGGYVSGLEIWKRLPIALLIVELIR